MASILSLVNAKFGLIIPVYQHSCFFFFLTEKYFFLESSMAWATALTGKIGSWDAVA